MRKTLLPLLSAFAFGCLFVACDDDDCDVTFANTPEIDAAGVYAGTFMRIEDGTTDTLYAAGTATIVPTDSAYCADITFDCSGDFEYNATSVTNIAHANDGFVFSNASTSNGLGAAFSGRIDGNGYLTASFSLTQRSGRVTTTYNYSFEGQLQGEEESQEE